MGDSKFKLYGIGGLGADHRVFQELTLNSEIIPVHWIDPLKNETIKSYSKRLALQINSKEPFGLIGVSFGGMLAVELNNYLKPIFTILISSASKTEDLPGILSLIRLINIIRFLPSFIFKPPFFIFKILLGAHNKKLLKEIVNDTNPHFVRWGINQIIQWDSKKEVQNLYLIHGSKDKLIPLKNDKAEVIDGGQHFMIVDKAESISRSIQSIIDKF